MHVGRSALVHHLGLALGVKILRDVAHDPEQFALPGLAGAAPPFSRKYRIFSCGSPSNLRRRSRLSHSALLTGPAGTVRHKSLNASPRAGGARRRAFLRREDRASSCRDSDRSMRHQGVRGVERLLDRQPAVPLLALRHVSLGKIQVIENSLGVRPLLEQIVVLEEMVVAERPRGRSPASAWSRCFPPSDRKCTANC